MSCVKHILKNGATFLQIPMEGVRSVTVLALVNAGRRYEEESVAGISHFLEHMVFKGTKKYPTARDLSAAIDQLGGEFNAFTSKEYTGYYAKLAAPYMETALDVVSDMLCTPLLRQDDIDKESGVIVEEINMYEDMPMRHIQDIFDELMFEGTLLEGKILGTKKTVKSMKTEDFQNYMNKWYGFKNVTFIIAGDAQVVGKKTLPAMVETYLQKGGEERKAEKHAPYFEKSYGKKRVKIVKKKTEQAHFVLGFPSFGRADKRRYELSVLATLFGKTMSSRLFSEVREKRGLCYYVRADLDMFHDVGTFGASAGVDPTRVQEAIDVVVGEFSALANEKPPTEQEVEAAKQNLIGSLLLELEDSQSVAGWYGMRQLLEEETSSEEEVIKNIQAVTLQQVQEVARAIIKPKVMRFALIGPFAKKDIRVADVQ